MIDVKQQRQQIKEIPLPLAHGILGAAQPLPIEQQKTLLNGRDCDQSLC